MSLFMLVMSLDLAPFFISVLEIYFAIILVETPLTIKLKTKKNCVNQNSFKYISNYLLTQTNI